jgi:hypothetical protein
VAQPDRAAARGSPRRSRRPSSCSSALGTACGSPSGRSAGCTLSGHPATHAAGDGALAFELEWLLARTRRTDTAYGAVHWETELGDSACGPTITVWTAVPACGSCVRGYGGEPRSWPARRAGRRLHDRRLQRWQRGYRRRQEPERRRLRLSCRRRDGRPGGVSGPEGVRGSHVLAAGRPRQRRHRVQALREPRGVRPHPRGRVLARTNRPVSTTPAARQRPGRGRDRPEPEVGPPAPA